MRNLETSVDPLGICRTYI